MGEAYIIFQACLKRALVGRINIRDVSTSC